MFISPDVKNMKIYLDLLRQIKDEASRKQVDLENSEEQMKIFTNEKDQMAIEMTPLLRRLKEIAKVEDDLAVIRGELSMLFKFLTEILQAFFILFHITFFFYKISSKIWEELSFIRNFFT